MKWKFGQDSKCEASLYRKEFILSSPMFGQKHFDWKDMIGYTYLCMTKILDGWYPGSNKD